jgi:hypothetical protein
MHRWPNKKSVLEEHAILCRLQAEIVMFLTQEISTMSITKETC